MKTKLLILLSALVAFVFAADTKKSEPDLLDAIKLPVISDQTLQLQPSIVIGKINADSSVILYLENGEIFFSMKGLRVKAEKRIGGGSMSPYVAPEKASEVIAELVTKDGRRWRAKWEEVKP